jgi:hypothetical protein
VILLSLDQQFSAKVLKRVGQLRRLGPRGLVHTAYVRTLGPTVYALTDPARKVAAGLHRRRALGRALPSRLERLKKRAATEIRGRRMRGIRTEFGSDVASFVHVLEATLDLAASGCAVSPAVAVDWESNAITCEIVKTADVPLDEQVIARIEDVLTTIHRAGYAVGEIEKTDLVFSADGNPVVVNLTRAIPLAGLSRDMSIFIRDADRRRFNELFGTRLLTATQLRGLLSPKATIAREKVRGFTEVYAPVILRDDIRWGKIWNTDLGTGRWNFIMRDHLPIPRGGSVLDLGSNNGFNPLQMLRAGAASAVGVEIEPQAIEQGRFLKSAYEWLDNCAYDFRYIHGSQADLPSFGLQRFDLVTALCSLYYLPEQQIRELVRYIRTLTPTLVLQCNTDRLIDRGGKEDTYRKASVGFAVDMLEQAGFADRQIIAPAGYSRPLVIGRAGVYKKLIP